MLDLASDEAHWSVALVLKDLGIGTVGLKVVTGGVKLVSLGNQLSDLSLLLLGLLTGEDRLEDSSFLDSDLLESLSGGVDNLSDLLNLLDQFLDRFLKDNNSLLDGVLDGLVVGSLDFLDQFDDLSSDNVDSVSDLLDLLDVSLDDLLVLGDLSLFLVSVNTDWLLNDLSDLSSDNSDSLSDGDNLLSDLLDSLSQGNNLLGENRLLGWLNLNSSDQVSDGSSDDGLLGGQLSDLLSELGNCLSEFDNLLDLWFRVETQLTWLLDGVTSVNEGLVLGGALSFLLEDKVVLGLESVEVGESILIIWVSLALGLQGLELGLELDSVLVVRAALVLDGNELSAALLELSVLSLGSSTGVDWLDSLGDLSVDVSDLLDILFDALSHDVDLLGDLVDGLSQDGDLLSENWLLWFWSSWD